MPARQTRMDAPHGQTATQDPRDLPCLPPGHPCPPGYRAHPEMITGEQGAGKLASPVREEADGKGPKPRAPRRRPTSLDGEGLETEQELPRQPLTQPTSLEECERAVRLYEASPAGERWYGAECSACTDPAATRLLQGELDGARDALAPVFALPPDKRVQGLVKRLGNVQRLLRQPLYVSSPDGRRLGQQVEGFASGAVSRALPGTAVSSS